jgi:SHS2 domain-containing protein
LFEILQHTADIRLRVRAASLDGLFRDAMLGMFAVMVPEIRDSRFEIRVAIDSLDRTSLLVDFLNAVLSRAHIDRVAFDDVEFNTLTETDLVAEVTGRHATFAQDVKAVTYHEANVEMVGDHWQTILVFDI